MPTGRIGSIIHRRRACTWAASSGISCGNAQDKLAGHHRHQHRRHDQRHPDHRHRLARRLEAHTASGEQHGEDEHHEQDRRDQPTRGSHFGKDVPRGEEPLGRPGLRRVGQQRHLIRYTGEGDRHTSLGLFGTDEIGYEKQRLRVGSERSLHRSQVHHELRRLGIGTGEPLVELGGELMTCSSNQARVTLRSNTDRICALSVGDSRRSASSEES